MAVSACGTQQTCYRQRLAMQNQITNPSLYSPSAFPLTGTTQILDITVSVIIFKLLSLNNDKSLSVAMEVDMRWLDPNLPVDWSSWPVNSQLRIDSSLIWTTNIFVANPATSTFFHSPAKNAYFYPISGGTSGAIVQQNVIGDFSVVCEEMTLVNFPFDSQHCEMELFYGDIPQVNFSLNGNVSVAIQPDDEYWQLLSATSNLSKNYYLLARNLYYGFSVNFVFQRRYFYYSVFLIMPLILLQAVAALTAVLPSDRGEKVVLGATLVVAMYILLTAVNQQIPQLQAGEVPHLVTALVVGIIMTGVILAEAVAIQTLRIIAFDLPEDVTRAIESCSKCLFTSRFRRNKRNGNASEHDQEHGAGAGAGTSVSMPQQVSQAKNSTMVDLQPQLTIGEILAATQQQLPVIRLSIADESVKEAERKKRISRAWRKIEYVLNAVTLAVYLGTIIYYFGYYIYIVEN